MVRTLLMPPLNASAGSWSWSWDRGSTLVAAEKPRGARSSRSSYSSYSSSSRPRYTMVFFMNEGAIPSPVTRQRSACSPPWSGRQTSRRRGRRTLSEQGAADPHHGRAGGNGDLQIVGHAHGALLELQCVGQPPHRLE